MKDKRTEQEFIAGLHDTQMLAVALGHARRSTDRQAT